MTAQSEPRMVPPDEARRWAANFKDGTEYHDIAMTAAVLGEQRDAVLVKCAEWADTYDCYDEDDEAMQMAVRTLRAIYGVTA